MKKYISFNNQIKEIQKYDFIIESNKELLIDTYNALISRNDHIKNIIHINLINIFEEICRSDTGDNSFQLAVLNKLLRNVAHVLKDDEQSHVPKLIIAEHIEEMYKFLQEMGCVKKDFLKTKQGDDIVSKFNLVSEGIKKGLDKLNSDKALTWNVRQFNLWAWCNVMAKHTASPVYSELLQHTQYSQSLQSKIIEQFQTLFDIETQFIVEIAIGDDAADNLSYEKLTDSLIQIPFSTQQTRNTERAKISSFMNGLFVDYFDLGVEIWDDAIEKFIELIGIDKYQSIEPAFREHYDQIMESMRYSMIMNTHPEGTSSDPVDLDTVDQKLPPNMMVRSFRFMEDVLADVICEREGISLPSRTSNHQKLVDLSQLTASWSNSFATIYRELKENDISNVLLISANLELEKKLKQSSNEQSVVKLEDTFTAFCEQRLYINHFFTESEPPKTFLELILYRSEITRDIYAVIRALKEMYHGVDGRKPLSDDLFEDPETIGKHLFYMYTTKDLNDYKTLEAANKFIDELDGVQTTEKRELKALYRRIRHIQLVDEYSKYVIEDLKITQKYIENWQKNIREMKEIAASFSTPACVSALEYVHSWELFMAMYLIFKHKPEGHI